MKKQSKKLMLVALALLALVTVALPLVGCKNDSVSEQTSDQTGEQTNAPGTGTEDGNGEAPKNTPVSFTDSSGKTQTFTMVSVQGTTEEGVPATEGSEIFIANRTVTLSAFEIGKHEVTQELYKAVMTGQIVTVKETEHTLNANPSNFTSNPYGSETQEKRPVESVSWYDAVYFCNELSKKLNLTPAYDITVKEVDDGSISNADVELKENANGYRLPTEAEWEYASRGGKPATDAWEYKYAGTNDKLEDYAWYRGYSSSKTHEVGKKTENSLGIHDMSGNVYEWCWDRDGSINADTPPTGPSAGSSRVDRGGSWNNGAISCGVSYRHGNNPSSRFKDVGFRVVRPSSK